MTQHVNSRIEHDLLGSKAVPAQAYWGVHTARAVENFPITGTTIGRYPDLIRALAVVKQAAARTNADLGLLSTAQGQAIEARMRGDPRRRPRRPVRRRRHPGRGGTSTNMNANEVIGNRALEIMGHGPGEYRYLHPADHVNMGQSTNDVYPTALRLATITACDGLDAAMGELVAAFEEKAVAFETS